jgi:two-component system sensor histidine kinase AgrC
VLKRDYYKIGIILFGIQLLLMSILVYGCILSQFGDFPPYPVYLLLTIGIAILKLCIVSIFIIRQLYIDSMRSRQQEVELLRLKHIEEQNRIHRQYRHDLYNHMTVISGLAQMGNLDHLMKYLDAYLGVLNKGIINISSGLKELDVLLYTKYSLAQNKSIDISLQCLEPLRCSQDNVVRVITILSNALDNAIQAADTAGEEKRVGLQVSGDSDKYIFDVTNTFDPAIDLVSGLNMDGFTTKAGGKGGQGIAIIRKTVSRLQGSVNYSVAEGFCHLRIEMPKYALGEGA